MEGGGNNMDSFDETIVSVAGIIAAIVIIFAILTHDYQTALIKDAKCIKYDSIGSIIEIQK